MTGPVKVHGSDHATLWHGDCIEAMRLLPDESIASVVTDPPYALDFMGHKWDRMTPGEFQHWCELWAREALRVLKPGGHLLAFGGTRTFHRLAAGVEDAGFEIRDSIAWLYGSGFPKSLNVSKAIDKAAGVEREVVGPNRFAGLNGKANATVYGAASRPDETISATDAAREWEGWGTALKPAFEPVVVARKPLTGTVAANVLEHGTGALNIDASRIGAGQDYYDKTASVVGLSSGHGYSDLGGMERTDSGHNAGRWPANVVLDESQAEVLDAQSGVQKDGIAVNRNRGDVRPMSVAGTPKTVGEKTDYGYGGSGGASRFFYVAKAPGHERPKAGDGTAHPTVKPVSLMRWLVKLVTPPGGTVLEPFAGSGTTIEAALTEGFHVIAIERDATYIPLCEQRMSRPMQGELF